MFSISLQDPAGIFELIEVVGNGTYGQVYKVSHECRLSRRRTTLRVFCRKTNHVICGGWCYQYLKFMCIIRLVSLAWVGTMYVNVYKKYIFVIVRHLIAGEFVLSQIFFVKSVLEFTEVHFRRQMSLYRFSKGSKGSSVSNRNRFSLRNFLTF